MGWFERVRRERSGRSTLSPSAMAYVGLGMERSEAERNEKADIASLALRWEGEAGTGKV